MKEHGFSRKRFLLILVIILILLAAGAYGVITTQFVVTDVTVDGNEHYTDEQIREMVLPGGIRNNSLYLSLLYRKKEIKDIPFIESMDVSIVNRNTIHVDVYEKTLAGCVNYLGSYLYFDKDGIVVESSSKLYSGVPQIEGLKFTSIVLGSKLDVGDDSVFSDILELTQAFEKYNLDIDKVYFDSSYNVTLYMNEVKIILGNAADITDRLYALKRMENKIANLKGTLYLSDYNGSESSVIFKKEN